MVPPFTIPCDVPPHDAGCDITPKYNPGRCHTPRKITQTVMSQFVAVAVFVAAPVSVSVYVWIPASVCVSDSVSVSVVVTKPFASSFTYRSGTCRNSSRSSITSACGAEASGLSTYKAAKPNIRPARAGAPAPLRLHNRRIVPLHVRLERYRVGAQTPSGEW